MSTVDPFKEQIVGTFSYMSPAHAIPPAKNRLFGKKVPHARKACEVLCKAHELIIKDSPQYEFLGWDGFITDDGEVVFFEGNFGS